MIRDALLLLDDLCDTRLRPHIAAEPEGFRSPKQQPWSRCAFWII